MRIPAILILLIYLVICPFSYSQSTGGNFVTVRGELELTDYSRDGKESTHSCPFWCVFGERTWQLEADSLRNAKLHFYCDGTNIYRRTEIVKLVQLPRKRLHVKMQPAVPDNTKAFGEITPGILPLEAYAENLVWLAYCSSAYLKDSKRMIPLPGCVVRETFDSFAYKDETILFADKLGLPQIINFNTSQTRAEASPLDQRLLRNYHVEAYRLNPPKDIKEGLVKARYEVIEETNILNWTIPTQFKYIQYREAGTDKLQFTATCKSVVSLTPNSPTNILAFDRLQVITDYRFRDGATLVDCLQYSWTNGYTPDVNDVRLRAHFEKVVQTAPPDPLRYRPVRRKLLFYLLTAPAILVIYLITKRKTKLS